MVHESQLFLARTRRCRNESSVEPLYGTLAELTVDISCVLAGEGSLARQFPRSVERAPGIMPQIGQAYEPPLKMPVSASTTSFTLNIAITRP